MRVAKYKRPASGSVWQKGSWRGFLGGESQASLTRFRIRIETKLLQLGAEERKEREREAANVALCPVKAPTALWSWEEDDDEGEGEGVGRASARERESWRAGVKRMFGAGQVRWGIGSLRAAGTLVG